MTLPFQNDLTQDGFLDRRLSIWQPRVGYRAATDPVFLAASIPAKSGQTVLELGCGVGVASLCLGKRVPGLQLTGVEIQPDYASLAQRNADGNGMDFKVVLADLTTLPDALIQRSFDHVIFNPPYMLESAGTHAANAGRDKAFREETPLEAWLDTGIKRLKPKGVLSVIHLAERLPDLLICIGNRLGNIEVKSISARPNRPAGRVIVRGVKGSRGPFRLYDPLIVHDGLHHDADKDSQSTAANSILRDGAALTF